MSRHLFGAVVTPLGVAANNRGETEGNLTTLQKLVWEGGVHTTVSAEAIRAAVRRAWQADGHPLNRQWDDVARSHSWQDAEFKEGGKPYLDDDLLGFMSARAAKEETNQAETQPPRRRRARGTTDARRARLEITRAISLDPWAGDVTFNAASPGATPAASRTGSDPVPYATELHATRYQYGFALTPAELFEPSRAILALDAIVSLSQVAGNHARFLYDFGPESIVLRWTHDPAPRLLYCFAKGDHETMGMPRLRALVEAGDIEPSELTIGGPIVASLDAKVVEERGARTFASVKQALDQAKQLLTSDAA
jgi:CRISPR-associated protein Cst2